MCLYSVVVPVYNSEHTLQELYTRLEKVFRETIKEGILDSILRFCADLPTQRESSS